VDQRTISAALALVITLVVGGCYLGIGPVLALISNLTNLIPYVGAGIIIAFLVIGTEMREA